MARESARADEIATPPEFTKGPSVTKYVRRMWEPGAGGWRPGGSDSAWMNQGSRANLSLAAVLRWRLDLRREAHTMFRSREAEIRCFDGVRAARFT